MYTSYLECCHCLQKVKDERAETVQQKLLPVLEDEKVVEESPPEKSDLEKLQESLHEREKREAELQQALKRIEDEMQKQGNKLEKDTAEIEKHRVDLDAVRSDLKPLKPLTNKIKDLNTQLSETQRLIDETSKDLKRKLQEEVRKRSLFETTTKSKFQSVKSEVKSDVLSEVRRDLQAEIPPFQRHMKEEFEKTVCQLRDEMEKKMFDMHCKMLQQFVSTTEELRREVLSLRQKVEEYDRRQVIMEGLREYFGGGKGDKS